MTATPQDHKSKTHEFEHAGKKYTIPAFSSLPMGAIRKSRKAENEMDGVFRILESCLAEDSEELAALDTMDSDEFEAFLKGWTQGAPVGESSSSES